MNSTDELSAITVHPSKFQLQDSDGTRIDRDTFQAVLRVLRQHKRNHQKETLHLVMDSAADVPWQISSWVIALDATAVQLDPTDEVLTPSQLRRAITLRVSEFALVQTYGTRVFTDFNKLISEAQEKLASTNGGVVPGLRIVSNFVALDDIRIFTPDENELLESAEHLPAEPDPVDKADDDRSEELVKLEYADSDASPSISDPQMRLEDTTVEDWIIDGLNHSHKRTW